MLLCQMNKIYGEKAGKRGDGSAEKIIRKFRKKFEIPVDISGMLIYTKPRPVRGKQMAA